jgi:hypothetical protein
MARQLFYFLWFISLKDEVTYCYYYYIYRVQCTNREALVKKEKKKEG